LVQGPPLGHHLPGDATFTASAFNYIDPRTGFFTGAYSTSPGMAVNMVDVDTKYPVNFVDANGNFPAQISQSVHERLKAAGTPFSCSH